MKLLIPKKARFSVQRIGKTLCNFKYKEFFKDKAVALRTANKLFPWMESSGLPIACRIEESDSGMWLCMEMKRGPLKVAINMIVGEFICWSDVGKATIAELMSQNVMLRAQLDEIRASHGP